MSDLLADKLPPNLSEADDAALRSILADVDLPALLPALAQLTGDMTLLKPDLRPSGDLRLTQGGLSDEAQSAARELAVRALARHRDSGCVKAPKPAEPDIAVMLSFLFGDGREDYLPLLTEELALAGDAGAPQWRLAPGTVPSAGGDPVGPAPAGEQPLVAVIGAGMSGLLAAYRLAQACVPYVVLEKNEDVGGTWLENVYPGCRVDVPSHLYSYSFAAAHGWPQHFSGQPAILDYFRGFARDSGVRGRIRFATEVASATWSEEDGTWTLGLRGRDGAEDHLAVRAVISAVGQLNRPKIPRIPGAGDFTGHAVHSARWDSSLDLAGKRVAVVGTGASALQIVPAIVDQVAELAVYQRSAPWLVTTPAYTRDLPPGMAWLLRHLPEYGVWYRFWLFCQHVEGSLPYIQADPDWPADGRSVSALNNALRELRTRALAEQAGDDVELLAKIVPDYPPGAKRMLRDDGSWVRALRRGHVRLSTDPIECFTERGIVTATGEREYDVVVYATGFEASDFLAPMTVTGRGGADLRRQWGGDARAMLGIQVPGFPNFFCLYGPNTNIVVNGSIIFFSECAVHYVMGCLRLLFHDGQRAVDCDREAHDAYNRRVDEGNARTAWGASGVESWYRNAAGRISQNWPFSLLEYWQLTRGPRPVDLKVD